MLTPSQAEGLSEAGLEAPGVLPDFMINPCRTFIFASVALAIVAIAAREALSVLQEPQRQRRLGNLVTFTPREIGLRGLRTSGALYGW